MQVSPHQAGRMQAPPHPPARWAPSSPRQWASNLKGDIELIVLHVEDAFIVLLATALPTFIISKREVRESTLPAEEVRHAAWWQHCFRELARQLSEDQQGATDVDTQK